MKVLITGCNGYLGHYIIEELASRGVEVFGLVSSKKKITKWLSSNCKDIMVGDIREEKIISKITDFNCETLIHLISLDHNKSELSVEETLDINVLPIWKIGKKNLATKFEKIIYISTIHVYESKYNEVISTETKVVPKNIYAMTHYFCEHLNEYYSNKNNKVFVNFRLGNSFGIPHQEFSPAWNLVVNDMLKGAFFNNKIIIKGDGLARRDFIDVRDVSKIIANALKLNKSITQNLVSGKSYRLIDVAIIIKNIFKDEYGEIIEIFKNNDVKVNEFNLLNPSKEFEYDLPEILLKGGLQNIQQSLTKIIKNGKN